MVTTPADAENARLREVLSEVANAFVRWTEDERCQPGPPNLGLSAAVIAISRAGRPGETSIRER